MRLDYRLVLVKDKLTSLKKTYVVLSSKGGVGKSTLSSLLAFYAAERGIRVGLIDLDFTNPSTHIVLGVDPREVRYVEEKGIIPALVGKLSYVTPATFTRDSPLPLRGESVSRALFELISILRLDGLKYLFIDTPPGMSDEHMDIIYGLGEVVKPVVVTTPSPLSVSSVRKMISLLRESGLREILLVENMGEGGLVDVFKEPGVTYLGYVPFYPGFDNCIGSLENVRNCPLRGFFEKIVDRLVSGD
ncbi:P-loop NTPase [Thermogladius calderae]|uniref:P-loop NTPase n=1 Tax=Thermogladius calderae TaxID=1200300 RepID=UPI0012FEFEED|nr:P-loop NTPase [Thermogladius calderae]